MSKHINSQYLYVYETDTYLQKKIELLFNVILFICIGLFICFGFYLKNIKAAEIILDNKKNEAIKTQFIMQSQQKQLQKKENQKKPLDLTKPAVLNQKENDIVKNNVNNNAEVRRVYGLRKVYSIGLGAGGSATEAVIGKLGNTINKEIDTIKATEKELKGKIASVTTVSSMPVVKSYIKPEYNDEMKKNGVAGTISAKLLIDIDGAVKEIIILNDLGYGSKESVINACKKLVFKPAMEGDISVAVWIVMNFKFVLEQ